MAERVVSVAEFSKFPGGRWKKDGSYSGEEFRETVLKPALQAAAQKNDTVGVNIDGVAGYASSFLEETFGGIVRTGLFPPTQLAKMLAVKSRDPVFAGFKADAIRYFNAALERAMGQ